MRVIIALLTAMFVQVLLMAIIFAASLIVFLSVGTQFDTNTAMMAVFAYGPVLGVSAWRILDLYYDRCNPPTPATHER